jgi:hypothetical protein
MKALNENKITSEGLTSYENLVSSPVNKEQQIEPIPRNKLSDSAVDFYKKLCLKLYISTNSTFVNLLKQDNFNLSLDLFTLKEMNLINKTVGKFNYFKQISLSASDPHSMSVLNY